MLHISSQSQTPSLPPHQAHTGDSYGTTRCVLFCVLENAETPGKRQVDAG